MPPNNQRMKRHRRDGGGGRNNNPNQQGGGNNLANQGFPDDDHDLQPEDPAVVYDAPMAPGGEAADASRPAPQMSDDDENGNGNGGYQQQPAQPPKVIHVPDLKKMTAAALLELAEQQGLENIARVKKQDLIFTILKAAARRGEHIYIEGVLEIMPDGYGFLRGPDASYLAGPDDVYISPSQIRRFAMRTGDTIAGRIRTPKDNERYFALLKVDSINFEPYEQSRKKVSFENLTPLFADEQFKMERGNGTTEDITARIIDLVAPFGKGQRGLIVSPPKAGKTIMMQNIAQSIAANYPDVYLIILLVDERPEEVTDMQRTVRCMSVTSSGRSSTSRMIRYTSG